MKKFKNHDELVEKLAEMIINLDIAKNEYQTDIYLYYDRTTGKAKLTEFINVGGNSWLNDSHYTVYCDAEHNECIYDMFEGFKDIAMALEITEKELTAKIVKQYDCDEEYAQSYLYDYINDNDDVSEKLEEVYADFMRTDMKSEYIISAENHICEAEENVLNNEEEYEDYEERM